MYAWHKVLSQTHEREDVLQHSIEGRSEQQIMIAGRTHALSRSGGFV